MSFTLIDQGSENFEFRASVWNWKTLLEIVRSFDVISEGTLRQMSYNASGTPVSIDDAHLIGEKIRNEVLPKMGPGTRIFADLSITDKPDDGTLYQDEDEKWKNYSADYEWLSEFCEFCFKSKGFQVF
ncbi:MAG: hypothetical protein DWQ47_12355 [Acidobacteria bacterium]|nr:MAG: hypothetical protein DWQ32_14770 [Acidobacteriota bacterium]REJ98360.1 MAG: hypothetical protein DWQ38_17570 [Acidobacteriota bacterium]REK17104.1 MAG: hypothetical protein DWQ43_02615 [Acidobacteriota bacterium]REK43014.1 MAG: hypothetical protein DWQ47_12355 [Acidobacteriota bacterium]